MRPACRFRWVVCGPHKISATDVCRNSDISFNVASSKAVVDEISTLTKIPISKPEFSAEFRLTNEIRVSYSASFFPLAPGISNRLTLGFTTIGR